MSVVVALSLLHFLWQGALIGGFAWVAMRIARTPTVRYSIGVGALIAMAATPVATVAWVRNSVAVTPQASAVTRFPPASGDGPIVLDANPRMTNDRRLWVSELGRRVSFAVSPSAARWLLTSWLLGVGLLSSRLTIAWLMARRLTRRGVRMPTLSVLSNAERLMRALNIKGAVVVLESALVQVPTAIGWLKPVVLLPASAMTGLSMAQVDALVAHELAHIKRHDYLVNLLQSAMETLLFYHPMVWMISRLIREERELCCDDLALAVCGNDTLAYASALADLEARRQTPAPALTANGRPLLARIKRILAPRPVQAARGSGHWIAGVTIVCATLAMFTAQSLLDASTTPDVRRPEQIEVRAIPPGNVANLPSAPAPSVLLPREPAAIAPAPSARPENESAQSAPPPAPEPIPVAQERPAPAAPAPAPAYVIKPADTLRVNVYSGANPQAEFPQRDYTVDVDGTVSLPMLPKVVLAGLTIDHANEVVRKALIENRAFVEATVDIAVVSYRSKDPSEPSADMLFQNAWSDYMSKRYDLAIEGFKAYLRNYAASPDAHRAQFNIGDAHYNSGRYAEAAAAYSALIRIYGSSDLLPAAHFKLGLCYLQMEMPDQAQEQLQLVAKRFPDSAVAALARARIQSAPVVQNFFVNGYVKAPGQYQWEAGLTLDKALTKAGGVGPDGVVNRTEVRRLNPTTKQYERITLDKEPLQTVIQPEDIIFVPKRRM